MVKLRARGMAAGRRSKKSFKPAKASRVGTSTSSRLDALLAYKDKRNFARTAEPEGKLQKGAGDRFCVEAAVPSGCRSVAFTYNDPVIFLEYAVDVAEACRERGVNTLAVSAGYICEEPRVEFFSKMDAANIDLKGFTEDFYRTLCSSWLGPVLETWNI
jgi:hypothetical protein